MQDSRLAIMVGAVSNPIVPPLKMVAILMAAGHMKTVKTITDPTTVLPMGIAVLAPALTTRAGVILMSSVQMSVAVTQTETRRAGRAAIIAKIPGTPILDRPIATGIRVEVINHAALIAITGKNGTLTGIIAHHAAMSAITDLTAADRGPILAIHAGRADRRCSEKITRDNRKDIQTIHRKKSYSKAITSISIRLTLPGTHGNTTGKTRITGVRWRNAT
jgi:hypothetical protein